MKEVVYNDDNINDSNIDMVITRIKGLLINSNNEIYLGKNDRTFQFPGGHLEKNESFVECLIREIKEETGIILKNDNYKPFYRIVYYTKNYNNSNLNVKSEVYYFIVNLPEQFEVTNTNFTEEEKFDNYHIELFKLENVVDYLRSTISNISSTNDIIVRDMIIVLEEYLKYK